jgi:Ser/Thr protein kinase RdoA (MazF antagonist)
VPLVLDVAHTVQQLAFYHGNSCDRDIFDAFLDAYQSVRPLAEIEKRLFDEALRYTVLVLSVWAHVKVSRGEMDKALFERVGNYYRRVYAVPNVG